MSRSLSSMRVPEVRLLAALRIFRTLDPEMQLLYAAAFLEIASKQPYRLIDLCDTFGISRATASRIHSYLSALPTKTTVDHRQGLGLIRSEPNPEHRKYLDLYLTARGRSVFEQVRAALERR